jgi:hypothetical protein
MTTAQLAELITSHITQHGLPEPASLNLTVHAMQHQQVQVQLRTHDLADAAAGLLAWANTHATVTLQAWLPPTGSRVHLDLNTTLTSAHGTADLLVYGGVDADGVAVLALEPGQRCQVPLSRLTAWANQPAKAAA